MSSLHLILFGSLLLIDFVLFNWGIFILFFAKGEINKMQKGRRILFLAFILFFIILLIALVFYLATFFLQKGGVFIPNLEKLGEFPNPLHVSPFPPAPELIGNAQ